MTVKPVVLSGIQSSGNLHIGNYIGAIQHWVAEQDKYTNFYMIADYHAITVLPDAQSLRTQRKALMGLLLACGLDPQKSVIFAQSDVMEPWELSWILTCMTPLGWLERMTQFKEKSKKMGDQDSIGAGLLIYPALQAADILIYQANYVPVGEDQRQHVELTRDVAQRFNFRYGEVFTIPEAIIRKEGARIMSLSKPENKMSKSDEDKEGCISLLDSPEDIRRKFKRATTDSQRDIVFDPSPERAGLYNLLTIYQQFSGMSQSEIEAHFADKGYKHLKEELGDLVADKLEPIRQRYAEITADPAYLPKVMREGAEKARAVASPTLKKARLAVGMD